MSDSPPPRIRVRLPGDAPARLYRWRQDETGQWWAEVTAYIPADAVHQVDGEDYAQVPREPATPPQPAEDRYVLAADTRDTPPTAELHKATCWTIDTPARWRRITPMPSTADARAQLQIPGTAACRECQPKP